MAPIDAKPFGGGLRVGRLCKLSTNLTIFTQLRLVFDFPPPVAVDNVFCELKKIFESLVVMFQIEN